MYIRLKTDHSLLGSTLNVKRALQLTLEAGYPFFAICETGHFASIAQGYKVAKQANIPFVAAIELTILLGDKKLPLIAVCKNQEGYQLLLKYHQQLNKPLDFEFLQQIKSENIILIPILSISELNYVEYIKKHVGNMFVGLTFAERLQPFEIEQIKQTEVENNVLCCMMNAIVMHDEKEQKTLAILRAIQTNSRDIHIYTTVANTFLSKERLEHLVDGYPELLARAEMIGSMTDFTLDSIRKIPKYPFTGEDTSTQLLTKLVLKGAKRRYHEISKEVQKRIKKELHVITTLDFADYFLILWDAKRYAFQHDILFGPGRGSSVGSIVAYCLGITEVDPLKYNLVFERFLNPGRKSYPDIDIDVADDKRELLITYIKNRYQNDRVAHILTYGTFGAKSAFREVARIHGISQEKIGEVTRRISHNQPLTASYQESKALQLLLSKEPNLMQCYQIALQIEGLKRNTSTHAAGIIITDTPLSTMMPVFYDGGYTTAWEMKELEESGFLKIDFLGLKNLTILDELEQLVCEANPAFQMNEIPLDDEKTFQYLTLGLTDGIFQLESTGVRKVLRDLKPTQFEDIVAVLALYRPGPMESIPQFIARKHGEERVEVPHPDLTPILSETYGVIVYQEQIMQIVNVMANFDFAQADDFRRAISKKNEQLLQQTLSVFEKAALAKNYAPNVVKKVSDLMLQFANYGFVKGHAVAYSLIAYRLMYFKVHYPVAFYSVVLNHHIQDTAKITTYVQEMKRRKIELLPPDIMMSDAFFKIEKKAVRMGYCSIKGIGRQNGKKIVDIVMGAVENTAQGLIRALLRNSIAKEQVMALIRVGAFSRFQISRQTLIHYAEQQEKGNDFSHLENLLNIEQEIHHYPEYTLAECEQFEREYLGYPFFQNVFAQFEKEYRENILLPIKVMKTKTAQVHQTVARVITVRKHRNGSTSFVQLADNTGEITAVMFDDRIVQNIVFEFGEIYHFTLKCSLYKEKASYQIIKIAPIIENKKNIKTN